MDISKLCKFVAVVLLSGISSPLFSPGQIQAQNASGTERKDGSLTAKRKVSCLGKLTPGDKLLALTGPYSLQGPGVVKELLVQRGDRVKKGQIVARLHHFDTAEAQVRQGEADAQVAAKLLEQVKAGEKAGAIAAQESLVLRCEAELKSMEVFLRRDKELLARKVISENDFERSQMNWSVALKNYDHATNQFVAFKEVRSVDVQVAQARVTAALSAVQRAQAELEQAAIRAPIDGTIVDILTYPGEMLDRNPLLYLGDTERMQVEAEVYVTDIQHVRTGARATVRGDGFEGEVTGTVFEIGRQVDRSAIFDPDPASNSDRRVVRVRIKLNDSRKVQNLINHQVNVVIMP